MIVRKKTCKQCKAKFTPRTSTQVVCSWQCAIEYGKKQTSKALSQDTRRRKEQLKTRAQWLKEAQTEFNKYIRLRDSNLPCISCGRYHTGQYHAGHYRTVGSMPALRFNEDNCHKQCAPCNNHLSGNIVNYRLNLLQKIGQQRLDTLEGKHEPLHLSIDDIKAIKQTYRAKCKELECEN